MADDTQQWMCDGEHFGDDAALARHLAGRLAAGEAPVSFARMGCWFRLGLGDDAAGPSAPRRAYTVTLVTNSPHCSGGNVFTATWPDGYVSEPADAAAEGAAEAASSDRAEREIARVLAEIGSVLWP